MYKFGLKVWSTNERYINDARKLYEQGLYSYIELYAVPGSFDRYVSLWTSLNIPFVIHAPHFAHGLNLSKKECEQSNQKILSESLRWADSLSALFVVVHPGVGGNIEQTAEQFKKFFDKRMLIENKPYHIVPELGNGQTAVGYLPEHIRAVMEFSGVGFCLDAGHAICAANALGYEPYYFVNQFNKLKPTMYHLTDGDQKGVYDVHWHFGAGTFDLGKIFSIYPTNSLLTIETEKKYQDSLADFEQDVAFLKTIEKKLFANGMQMVG
ncbi:sugar phosphate isomerase/epimerase [Candidatus Babeliales bacterium]|nr:sugar phosphate isomerase/epimerase [Candidatus Babeliales bacterium]